MTIVFDFDHAQTEFCLLGVPAFAFVTIDHNGSRPDYIWENHGGRAIFDFGKRTERGWVPVPVVGRVTFIIQS